MPRVEYRKEKITQADIDYANEKTKSLQEMTQKKGLGLSMKNLVNTDEFMKKTGKE